MYIINSLNNLFKAYKVRVVPKLTDAQRKKRLRFARWWRKDAGPIKQKQFMFSDEKLFVVDGGLNRQNHRVYAMSREEADEKGGNKIRNNFALFTDFELKTIFGFSKQALHDKEKFPLSVMVWVGLTVKGATPPHFIEPGLRIDAKYYCKEILPIAKQLGTQFFGDKWVIDKIKCANILETHLIMILFLLDISTG